MIKEERGLGSLWRGPVDVGEKAYPTLQVEAQELLALNQFLTQIENQQLAFAVW